MTERSLSAAVPDRAHAAQKLVDAVSARVGITRFGLWFRGHVQFVPLGKELVVAVRNQHTREWLEQTFGAAVKEAASEVCGGEIPVRWAVDGDLFDEPADPADRNAVTPQATRQKAHAGSNPSRPGRCTDLFGDPVLPHRRKGKTSEAEVAVLERPVASAKAGRRWKVLSDFVVGACNRVAHASALSVVEEPGDAANPLVIHGPVGTGKTHLLEGVFAGLKRSSNQRPCYVTAEEFTTKFVQAARLGKMSSFRRQFRECTALLLDNLNFLANKRGSVEEFLYTFDALLAEGKQVVVTMDCHPRLADELMPELVDRLLGGAVWGLLPPDAHTRLAILRHKSSDASPAIPDSVLKSLATTLRGNVRELEGAINSLRHFAKVSGRRIDQSLVRDALGDLLRHAVRVVTVDDVDEAVCATLRLASGALQSKSRAWSVTHPRMVAIYLCRKHTAATYSEISKHFGTKTHSTAVAADKKVRGWLEQDASIAIADRDWPAKELVERIERELQR